jgi:hypothetical protein
MRLPLLSLVLFFALGLSAQRGKQGNLTVNAANTIVNEYTSLTANANQGSFNLQVTASSLNANSRFPNVLQPGDLIVIVQMQGATITSGDNALFGEVVQYNNAGNYEWAEVKSIPSSTSIELTCGLANNYTAAGKVQIIRVPRYNNLILSAPATVTAPAWNGTIGGVVVIETNGTMTLNGNNNIDVTGKGFRGGIDITTSISGYGVQEFTTSNADFAAQKGEGIAGFLTEYDTFGGRYGRAAAANGGGGGNSHNCGGGGGANGGDPAIYNGLGNPDLSIANWAQAWNLEFAGFANNTSSGGGRGGYSFSGSNQNALLVGPVNSAWGGDFRRDYGGRGGRPLAYNSSRVFMGGGGGAGEENANQGGEGGEGGGIVLVRAFGNITGTGAIKANGGNGDNTTGTVFSGGKDGAGGGGGGGAVILRCSNTIGAINIEARGGNGGNQDVPAFDNEAEGPGGGGGGGYVAITNAGANINVAGGNNGTTDSAAMTEFPSNGATRGGSGTNTVATALENLTASPDTLCTAGDAILIADLIAGATYSWSASVFGAEEGTGNSLTYPATAGQTLYVSACPLAQTISTEIVFVSPPTANAGLDATICEGASFQLSASSDGSYVWDASAALDDLNTLNPTVTPIVTEAFVLQASNPQGCLSSDTVTIVVLPKLNLSISNDTSICVGDTIQIEAISNGNVEWTGTSYLSSSSDPTPLISTQLDAAYYVLSTALGFCETRDTIVVLAEAKPSVNAGVDQLICEGETVQLAGASDAPFTWDNLVLLDNPAVLNPNATPNSNVSFVLLGLNAAGCSSIDTVSITVYPQLALAVSSATTICAGDTIQISAQTTGNIAWTSVGYISDPSSLTPMVAPTSDALFIAEVQEAGFCNSKDTVSISVSALPAVDAGSATALCAGSSIQLNANAEGTYNWIADASLSATDVLTPTVSPLVDTWYYLESVNIDGCEQIDSVFVGVDASLQLIVSNDTSVCQGTNIQLNASGATDYLWNQVDLLNNSTVANPTANITETTEFIVTASNSGNCETRDTVQITVFTPPIIAISTGGTFCETEGLEIFVNGVESVVWSPATGLTDPNALNTTANPTVTTTYTAQYTDENGCIGIAGTSTVVPGNLPVTGFSFNQISNYEVIFESDVEENQTTTWLMNGTELFGDSVLYNFPFDNNYTITQIVSNGCGSDTLVLVIEVVKQVGIEDIADNQLQVFPNPAVDHVLIRLDELNLSVAVLQVFSADGKLIYHEQLAGNSANVSVIDWSSGMYEIVVTGENQRWKRKLIR